MNNFTKDELETLLCGLSHLDEINPDSEVLLTNKIKSMIETYCEHEWNAAYAGHQGNHFKCHKCDKVIP